MTRARRYPGRLAVEFQCPPDDRVLRLDTRVADIQEESPTLQSLLNELNVNAAGWWWWIDHMNSSVHCSINCAVDTATWWWPNILMGVLPNYAATTEALANRLAMVGRGSVVQASHPEKGPRPELDGWILGTRLGERKPVASLDLGSRLSNLRDSRRRSESCGPITSIACRGHSPRRSSTTPDGSGSCFEDTGIRSSVGAGRSPPFLASPILARASRLRGCV